MTRRRPPALLVVLAALITVALVAVALWPRVSDSEEPTSRQAASAAQDFLHYYAGGNYAAACLVVVENGGLVNPCEDVLKSRVGPKPDPSARVVRARVLPDGTGVVEGNAIHPNPAGLTVTLRPGPSGWRVSKLCDLDLRGGRR